MKTVVASTRLTPKESKLVGALAEEEGLDRAAMLRRLVHVGLETVRRDDAVRLYSKGRVTLSRASEIAGVSYQEMLGLLAHYNVNLNYGVEDFDKDLTVKLPG